ncbi:MAG: hypothetical protein HY043_22820 [Verrucomicrobia bacterium]|nr:hypothetical protein [Verrucomicrobiota bacterium]
MKISTAVYGGLIRAYPKAFREKYGSEMAQVFREQCRDAATSAGGFGLTKLWLRVLLDLVKSCSSEYIAALGGNMNMFKQALLGRLWLAPMLALLVVGGVSAGVSAFLLPKLYQSSARIVVEKPTQTTVDPADFDPFWLQTQFEIIRSPAVLNEVIDNLSLSQRWAALFGLKEPLGREETLRWLRNQLEIRQTRNTTLIEIRVSDQNSKEAAEIANEIAAVYGRQAADRVKIEIGVRDRSPKQAADIANEIADTVRRQSAVQGRSVVQIVDQASPALCPIRPNIPLNTVVGGLLAAFATLLLVLVVRLFRKRVAAVG